MPSSRRDGFRSNDVGYDEACAILGGTSVESEAKLQSRYRELMRELHTDVTGEPPTERLKQVTMAHSLIKATFAAVRNSDIRYDIPDPQALNDRITVATPTDLSELIRKAAANVDPAADASLDSYLDCVRDDPVAKWDPHFLRLMLGNYIEGPVSEALRESELLDSFDPKEHQRLTEIVERAVVFEATATAMQGFTYQPLTNEARPRIAPAKHMDAIIRLDPSLGMGIGYDRVAATRRLADVTVKRLMEHVDALQNPGAADAARAAAESRAQERLARIMRPRHETDQFALATSTVAAEVLRHYMKSSDPAEWEARAHRFMGGPLALVLSAIQYDEPIVPRIKKVAYELAWTPGVSGPPEVEGVAGNPIGLRAVFEAGVAQAVRAGVELGLAGVNVQTTQVPAFLRTCEAEMRGAARQGRSLEPGEWAGDRRGGIFKGPWAQDWGKLVASSTATMVGTAAPDLNVPAPVLDRHRSLGAGAIRLALPPGEGWKPSLPDDAKVVEPIPSVGAMPLGAGTVEEPLQPDALSEPNLVDGGSVAEVLEARAGLPDAFRDRVELWRPAPPPTPSPPIRRLRRPTAGRTPARPFGDRPFGPADPAEPPSLPWDEEELPDHDYEGARHQPSWGRVQDLDLEGIGELERSPEASGEIDL